MNIYQKICLIFFIFVIVFWIFLFQSNTETSFYNYLYSLLFSLIPLIGGGLSVLNSKLWGGFKSIVGKAVFFIGLGLFSWGYGGLIWSYYNFFLNSPAPYPSLADIGFASSIFFYSIGSIYLSRATGVSFALRNKLAKFFLVFAVIIILIFSYYILVIVARGGILIHESESTLKVVLDIAYPIGDFISLSLAVIISGLSFQYLGGAYKFDITSILIGLATMFIGDSIFSYTTTTGTYYNGNIGDLILTLGLFFMTFGILGFNKLKV